jgi:putative methionine-R-sulfoxide reductase with GAF domain
MDLSMASQGSPLSIFKGMPRISGRRASVRQKVHSPAYASFDGIAGGMVLDLSEVLNVSETGIAIRSSAPLVPNKSLNLVLDLSETKTYINISGFVVWTDKAGRAGIRFSQMPEWHARKLKEWLFFNALTAVAKAPELIAPAAVAEEVEEDVLDVSPVLHAAPEVLEEDEILQIADEPESEVLPEVLESEALESKTTEEPEPEELPQVLEPEVHEEQAAQIEAAALADATPVPDEQLVADAPTLNTIRQQVEALASSPDAALNLLVERARSITRAAGAAIALAQGEEMVCRASSGEAPPLGTHLQVGAGFSGECVRTGRLQRCNDSEVDPLVDRESCRALGIRAMIAAPVIADGNVIGLIEVFSPDAYAFEEGDAVALHRLAEIIGHAAHSPVVEPVAASEPPRKALHEPARAALRTVLQLLRNKIVLTATAASLFLVIAGLLILWILHRPAKPVAAQTQPPVAQAPVEKPLAETLDDLRKYAQQGDPIAQFALGARYARGVEVKLDQAEAAKWFSKAAEQGHVGAQAALGAYYWAGRGVPQDLGKAYFWSALARANGDEGSKYRVATLSAHMSRAQITEAQQRANEWLQQHQGASASLSH